MDMDLNVQSDEIGVIRVFSLDMPLAEARKLVEGRGNGHPGLPNLLGISGLDRSKIELLDPADLRGVGLANYLIDGLGADADEVSADGARLAGLKGTVLILFSGAFSGRGRMLEPREPVVAIGSYREAGSVPPVTQAPVAGARGLAGASQGGKAAEPEGRSGRSWMWVAVAAVILLGLWLLIGTAG